MPSFSNIVKASAFTAIMIPLVAGHGYVKEIQIGGVSYPGYLNDQPYQNNPTAAIGWAISNPANVPAAHPSNGVVDFTSPDIICGDSATPAATSAPVAAGSLVTTTWGSGDPKSQWPHYRGIVLNYMAYCGSGENDCSSKDRSQLDFFKISETRGSPPDNWAIATIHSKGQWDTTIPATLPSGSYVLRQELINLDLQWADEAWTATSVTDNSLLTQHPYYGAQVYPACLNLHVTNSQGNNNGQGVPPGKKGNALYSKDDPSFTLNIFDPAKAASYPLPGPTVIPCGQSDVNPVSQEGCGSGNTQPQPQPSGSANMRFARRERTGYYSH